MATPRRKSISAVTLSTASTSSVPPKPKGPSALNQIAIYNSDDDSDDEIMCLNGNEGE